MTRTYGTETQLRSLDAARTNTRTPGDHHRAQQDLQRILGSDPYPTSSPAVHLHLPPRKRTTSPSRRKLIGAAALVTATTAGLSLLPAAVRGDQAFASWAPAPAGLTVQQQADATSSCRAQQRDSGANASQLQSARPAVAERRGTWTTVLLAGPDGFSALCITDTSAGFFAGDMIGSSGATPSANAPGPRDAVATDLGTGTMRAGDISLAAGQVGTDVTGVTYRSRAHGGVTATVNRGRFALWLPGAELIDASRTGVQVYVTYRDGTTGTTTLDL